MQRPSRRREHVEHHRGKRIGWLRAAVLGADDGIVTVSSIAIGVIASGAGRAQVLAAAAAALAAGAMSMAAGEYVSVSSQRDTELSDLAQERSELASDPAAETRELAMIYRRRGLPADLAQQVADALMANNPIQAHARDELGITEASMARPLQAAASSALSFTLGGALPLLAYLLSPSSLRAAVVIVTALAALMLLGVAGAEAGGAPRGRAAIRVGIGGALAIAVTAGIGHLVGAATG